MCVHKNKISTIVKTKILLSLYGDKILCKIYAILFLITTNCYIIFVYLSTQYKFNYLSDNRIVTEN